MKQQYSDVCDYICMKIFIQSIAMSRKNFGSCTKLPIELFFELPFLGSILVCQYSTVLTIIQINKLLF